MTEAFPPVPWEDYLASILADYEWGKERAEVYPVYFFLNACRTAAALLDKKVLSKSEGGLWGLQRLEKGLQPLIQKALAVYDKNQPGITFSKNELEYFIKQLDNILRFKEGR